MYTYLIVSDTYLVQVALCIGLFENGAVLCIQDQLQRELAKEVCEKGRVGKSDQLNQIER
jgi:hypothetical protein